MNATLRSGKECCVCATQGLLGAGLGSIMMRYVEMGQHILET